MEKPNIKIKKTFHMTVTWNIWSKKLSMINVFLLIKKKLLSYTILINNIKWKFLIKKYNWLNQNMAFFMSLFK